MLIQTTTDCTVFTCYINGLMQERRNSIANALELRLSRTNPSIWSTTGRCHMIWRLILASTGRALITSKLTHWPLGDLNAILKNVIFNLVLLIRIFRSSYDNALRWMPQDLTDDQSTLVQVMAWCCQATSHYLSQCWPRSLSPYGITRPQWVKSTKWRYIFLALTNRNDGYCNWHND